MGEKISIHFFSQKADEEGMMTDKSTEKALIYFLLRKEESQEKIQTRPHYLEL